VTKQPVLPNFPPTFIATSKRSLQALIRSRRSALVAHSISGYDSCFESVLPSGWLAHIDPSIRHRSFGAIPVFWTWLSQIFENNASCAKGVSRVQAWYEAANLPVPSGGTSAYCRARQRLSPAFLDQIHRKVLDVTRQRTRLEDRWNGLTLKAIDGSSVQLLDTEANQRAYPQPSAQSPGCGFPVMGIHGLLNLSNGTWEAIDVSDFREGDAKMALKMTGHLREGDLLLGDRAYCSYPLICSALEQGAEVLFRLHGSRHRKLDWRRGKHLSKHARQVVWKKPFYQEASPLTRVEWSALPETITVRLIKMKSEDRTGQLRNLVVATTLLDVERYDETELFELYARRWEIEVRFRDLKTSLGMDLLRARSPEMARKTIQILAIAYNLIRAVMQAVATVQESPLKEVGFRSILDRLITFRSRFRELRRTVRQSRGFFDDFINICARQKLQIRPHRSEPRALKRRPKNYALLTETRGLFEEKPHRSRHRKSA
jgi:hypothetical protein